jgi:hypothetical protein
LIVDSVKALEIVFPVAAALPVVRDPGGVGAKIAGELGDRIPQLAPLRTNPSFQLQVFLQILDR